MANFSVPSLWPTVPRRRTRFWNYPRPYRTGWRAWVPSWRVVVGTMLTGISLAVGLIYAGYTSYAIPEEGQDVGSQTTTVYYADGTTVMGEFAALDRVIVDPAQMPNWDLLTGALVASEDQTYWENSGIDLWGIGRAALNNAMGKPQQGGSTITQQYVEQYYGSGKTYKDKLREVFLAYKVTQAQEKDVIIERYLNVIYFGRKAYGIQAGAQAYFGVNAADLDYNQVAFLIGTIPGPNRWDGTRDPEWNQNWVKGRWERSIDFMAEAGVITPEQKAAAVFPVPVVEQQGNAKAGTAGYLLDMVKSELADPERANISEADLMTQGYKIITTIDPAYMAAAEAAMALPADASPILRASLTSIDPATGAIKALYGGPDYLTYPTNAATYDTAQAGSTFKPFTLLAGLESGVSIRQQFDGNNGLLIEGYANKDGEEDRGVTNFGNASFGQVDLIKATQDSINTAYVQLNKQIGPELTSAMATRLGIPETYDGSTPVVEGNLANVLGSASVHNLDLAHAYATIAAQGVEHEPYIVQKVTTLKDDPKYDAEIIQNQAVRADLAAAATYAMTQVVEKGSGTPAKALGRPAAGKTGTSTSNQSAWFAGYVPQLTTVVGLYQFNNDPALGPVGYQQITSFGKWKTQGREITGGSWPVEAWTAYMTTVMNGQEVQQFPEYKVPKASPSPSPSPTITGVVVPGNLVGMDLQEASKALADLGLQVASEPTPSTQQKGTVIEVAFAGQTVPAGSTIALKVSTGNPPESEQTSVPRVVGESQNQVQRKLDAAGLQPANGGTEPSDTVPIGMAIRTDPPEGTTVARGTTVTVYYSSGPSIVGAPTPTPTPTPTGGFGGGGGGGGNG
ncbi:transglycosylase domain-containing protein [Antribacter sp. KLBMP9083]|uniref:Transglycosylase domain-containing protein n=1 Tax=Antribacter soli TaxID=2910976 RepID=A0AA41U8K3_9MICO|nr:transglycosylase domain-containing protein [Antribacter soli]MCF4120572.1 transglycosylase domain-containing protein [Antribacter soli]